MTSFLWPKSQDYKFENVSNGISRDKLVFIENFFAEKYNSKYCALVPSARTGIILSLKYKNFNKSKIVQLPRWSSNCLVNAVGSIASITSSKNNVDCKILVHHLGQSFKTKKSKSFLIDDSSDSLPTDRFKSCKKSKYSEVISLPKIIGSYAGGILLTNNKSLYFYVKKYQNKNLELANKQSLKKYQCIIEKTFNFDWYHDEVINYSLDFNTINNVYRNLDNFDKNKKIILKRKEIFSKYILYNDKYRLGSCLILKLKKKLINKTNTYHFNISKNIDHEKFMQKIILPIHFTTNDSEIEKFFKIISKN